MASTRRATSQSRPGGTTARLTTSSIPISVRRRPRRDFAYRPSPVEPKEAARGCTACRVRCFPGAVGRASMLGHQDNLYFSNRGPFPMPSDHVERNNDGVHSLHVFAHVSPFCYTDFSSKITQRASLCFTSILLQQSNKETK